MATYGSPVTTGHQSKAGGERQPGLEHRMEPKPEVIRSNYEGSNKLVGHVAIITGADSGIGQAVAVHYAREGAKGLTISYLDEHKDAQETKRMVEEEGCQAILMAGDVGDDEHCKDIVDLTLKTFGRLDCLVNNAAEQHVCNSLLDITKEQLERTFRTNIFGYFYMAQAALPHLGEGSSIINTTSVTAYKGHKTLLDYSSTKGAIVSFTRSLSLQLADKKIRVNGVAPGPIWTPLIPATFPEEKTRDLGKEVPMERSGQPSEVAPSYVFLASRDGSYFNGQVLHPNGGSVVNG
jgi:NAD(P)-dependent dehydrogenase (short-subunit alcohol dehydrogenase family)